MASRPAGDTTNTIGAGMVPAELFQLGKERTETVLNMQKELLGAYEEASKAWVARVKSEVEFWSELASKLTATRSVPESVEACRDGVSQRMQMAAEDGRRMFEEGQKIIGAVTRSLANGWPAGKAK